jgi:DNA mismatch endonuclease, patch repair protein
MDNLTPQQRSENMRRVRSKGTKPEVAVRNLVHSLGYRYRLHDKKLAGTPDLVFTSRRKIILVHGCFWHQHTAGCKSVTPKSNTDFWAKKLQRNILRDSQNLKVLKREGWKVLTIWECQIGKNNLAKRIVRFLGDN